MSLIYDKQIRKIKKKREKKKTGEIATITIITIRAKYKYKYKYNEFQVTICRQAVNQLINNQYPSTVLITLGHKSNGTKVIV